MNLFKNALVYRLNRNLPFVAAELQEQMEQFRFTGVGAQDMAKSGWVPALVDGTDNLVHEVNGHLLLKIRKEEKLLPAAVLRKAVAEKVAKLESEQSRKLKKTEKDSVKDEVLHSLLSGLPKGFTRDTFTQIWIDTKSGLITVYASSAKKAEDALALLRKSLGSLPVTPVAYIESIPLTMTAWLKGADSLGDFSIGSRAVLHGADSEVVTVKDIDLQGEDVMAHIESGMFVNSIDLSWQDKISFRLSGDGAIKQIKVLAIIQDKAADHAGESDSAETDFLIFTEEFAAMLSHLASVMGGEDRHE